MSDVIRFPYARPTLDQWCASAGRFEIDTHGVIAQLEPHERHAVLEAMQLVIRARRLVEQRMNLPQPPRPAA
jgi:hypothetical protein